MTRGAAAQTKVLFQGNSEDFIVFVDSAEDLEAWKNDKSIPLAQVVSGFKIMVSHKSVTILFHRPDSGPPAGDSVWLLRRGTAG